MPTFQYCASDGQVSCHKSVSSYVWYKNAVPNAVVVVFATSIYRPKLFTHDVGTYPPLKSVKKTLSRHGRREVNLSLPSKDTHPCR